MTQLRVPDIRLFLEPRTHVVEELNELLQALETPATRDAAILVLHELAGELERRGATDRGLRLTRMVVPGCDEPIRLILHPATFEPEQWGKTFAEGLFKEPEIFSGKTIAELGTGSGWISILLLKRTGARYIVGLDLNPVAVAIARLNAWLNGSEPDGRLKLTPAGVPLVEAFRVAQSDLLLEPLARKERFDHVIGCIPQVLHPHPEAMNKRKLTARELYDLSNYCFEQGILEDRFGLPLIARALEQAQLCLNPGGLVTLILGGRPGREAIDGVFRRRGYEPVLWWSRRIHQADDTDIGSLAQLEKTYGIKFHFYCSYSSKRPIPASTAMGLLEKGHELYHDLLVMQARTRFEKPMIAFVKNINALGLGSLRREIDLSRVSEEQISFLERLTRELLRQKTLPYPHERGDKSLREKLSQFLKIYCGFATSSQRLFVGPERAQLVDGILSMIVRAGDSVLLSNSVDGIYSSVLAKNDCAAILGNDDLSELMELDNLFQPKVSLLAPHEMSDPSPLVLQAFVKQARANPQRWYLIDDSANFDIASELRSNIMLRMLGETQLPPNLVFIYGLIKNTVCPDLQLSFMINPPDSWIHGLDVAAELSYSRIAYPSQLYYEWLLDEMLAFPFPDDATQPLPPLVAPASSLSTEFIKIAGDAVFAEKPVDVENDDVIRLDYGEFEAPVPNGIVRGLIKGFLEPGSANELGKLVTSRVAAYMKFTRYVTVSEQQVVLGQGAFPLLGNLIQAMKARLGRPPVVALPQGSYGPVFPLIQYHGGQVALIETQADQGFLITLQALARMSEKPDLLWLTQPNNPSGLYFEHDTVAGIVQLCAERGIYLLADEIFFLLSDPKLGAWTPPHLSFGSALSSSESKWVFIVDGLSKSFAAGGLRSGFMICPDEQWAHEIQSMSLLPPASTLRAWDSLYSVFLEQAPHQMMNLPEELEHVENYLASARSMLADQRDSLLALLASHGLDDGLDNAKRGGLFVLARLGDKAADLARKEKLLINPPEWARTPGWCRVCFSLEPARFHAAMQRLQRYLG